MSDTKPPQIPSDQPNENEEKQEDLLISDEEMDDNHFLNWILENDIRVIFWGEHHYTKYTCLEFEKFQKCCSILKAIYIEECNENVTPDTESETYRKYLISLVKAVKEEHFDIYGKVTSYLVSLNATAKLRAFGCQSHRYTRETLEKAIAETKKGELTIIMIGSAHLSAITDPIFIGGKFQGPPLDSDQKKENEKNKDGNEEKKADDATVTYQSAEEALIAMAQFPDRVIEHPIGNLITSYGLIDFYAAKFDFGMLVVHSNWRDEQMIDYNKGRQKRSLLVNQSVRKLMTRLKDRKNIYITINTREWDKEYWKILQECRQNSLFDEFDANLPKSVPRFIFDNLYGGVHKELSKEFQEKYGWHNSFRLYFTSLTPAIPAAPDPIEAIDWGKLEQTDLIDEAHYQDYGSKRDQDYGEDFDEESEAGILDSDQE